MMITTLRFLGFFILISLLVIETESARFRASLIKIHTSMKSSGKDVKGKISKINDYLKTEAGQENAETVASAMDTIAGSVDRITGDEITGIVTGTLDIISAVTSLIPVYGPIVSTAFSLVSTVIGAIGGSEDVGSLVSSQIESALKNYEDSQLRAEASATARIYRNSHRYLSAAENFQHSFQKHELATLTCNVPISQGVKFLGILASKIKKNSQSTSMKQTKRAVQYIRLYVRLAVLRSAVLWQMYSLVKSANHSKMSAEMIKEYISADEKEDVECMKFLTSPDYSRAVFFANLYPSKLPDVKTFLSKAGLHFQKLKKKLAKGTHTMRAQKWKKKKWYMMMSNDATGSMRGTKKPGTQGRFYFDTISSTDNIFYIRPKKWPKWYVYMKGDKWGHCRGWKGKPGNQGKWKIVKFNDGRYMLSTKKWPNYFMYMKSGSFGIVRGWKNDPGTQGHWIIS